VLDAVVGTRPPPMISSGAVGLIIRTESTLVEARSPPVDQLTCRRPDQPRDQRDEPTGRAHRASPVVGLS
jgi:hypothetical protein